jgi:tetratricopeptide (TPR) repeat protein
MARLTPAQAHKARVLSEREARAKGVVVPPRVGGAAPAATGAAEGALPETKRVAAMLAAHAAELKALKSVDRKVAFKAAVLPEYAPYIAGALDAGAPGQDDVFVTLLFWHIDAGDLIGAMEMAAHALTAGMESPVSWSRDLPAALLEEVADKAAAIIKARAALGDDAVGTTPDDALVALREALDLTADADMHDQVRAKAFKALGTLLADSDQAGALAALREALRLDPASGVKTRIASLEKALSVADEATGVEAQAEGESSPAAAPGAAPSGDAGAD